MTERVVYLDRDRVTFARDLRLAFDPKGLPAPARDHVGGHAAGKSPATSHGSRRIVVVPPPGPPLWFTERPWTRSGVFAERGERVVERAIWRGLLAGVALLVVVQLGKCVA